MITTSTTDPGITDADRVLAEIRGWHAAENAATAAQLDAAARWADLHPAESRATAARYSCGRDESTTLLAGTGAPMVDQWCVAELAAALHQSTEAGQRLIGEALEMRHRLPRLWRLVQTGALPAWQARRVAARTLELSVDAAAYVDRQVLVSAGRIGPVLLDRLVAAAVTRFMPAEAARREAEQAERRCFELDHRAGEHGLAGQSHVYGVLDLADALDLDAAIADGARLLKELGDTASLGVRRARAAGDLARRQPCLDLPSPPDPADDADPSPRRPASRSPRQVVLYLHLSELALTGQAAVGRLQNTQTPVLTTQIREWLGQADTQVTVKPVIDLRTPISVDAYEIPDRIREHVVLRNPTCVFPWCQRTSTWCDLDHVVAYDDTGPPGQTSTDNLAPLCRRHHRLKTFTGWRYRVDDLPGTYRWTSPHGQTFLRDHTGTTELDSAGPDH